MIRHPICAWTLVIWALGSACATQEPGEKPSLSGPTWRGDVQLIMAAKCQGCHEAGAVAGLELGTYAEVSRLSTSIRAAVEQRRMPPWAAAEGCNEYQGDFSLSEEERQTILDWVDAGAPEGDGPHADIEPLTVVPDLPRVDLVLRPQESFVPKAAPDDYRCFLMDWPGEELSYVTGYQVVPDAESIVHHVIAYILPGAYRGTLEALEAEDDRPGYSCYGGPGAINLEDAAWLGGWAPGGEDRTLPEGTGIRVEPGSLIVQQVHYHISEDNQIADQTRIDVMIEDEVEYEAWIQPFANPFWLYGEYMEIPAGSTDHEESFSYTFRDGGTIYSANLHMHQLGQSARFSLERADGSETCLLDVPVYDFDWQRTYTFEAPVVIGAGDRMTLKCRFDNPTQRDVHWGDGTDDEMCLATMLMID